MEGDIRGRTHDPRQGGLDRGLGPVIPRGGPGRDQGHDPLRGMAGATNDAPPLHGGTAIIIAAGAARGLREAEGGRIFWNSPLAPAT